jgi:hypothetical protein
MKTTGAWRGLAFLVMLAALCAVPFGAGCGNGETVAVLDIEDNGARLPAAVLEQLADHLSGKIGEGGDLHVLPRPTDGIPEADIDYVLAPRILRPGDRCSLVLKLFRRQGRATIRSTSVQANCDADGLLDAIDVAVFRLGSPGFIPPRVEPPRIVLAKQPARATEEPPSEEPPVVEPARTAEPSLTPAPIAPPAKPATAVKKPVAARPKVEAPKEPPGPELPGYLSISTQPWSEIHVDGRKVGYSPIFKHPLPAGAHALTLLSADGQRQDIQIDIQPGKTRKVLHRFEEEPSLSNGGTVVEQQQGMLLVNSTPWSRVSVDGQSIGVTPLLGVKLPVGPHTVVLETDEGLKKEFAVIIEAGTQRKIIADLTEKPSEASRPPLESPPDPPLRLQSSNGH